MCIRRHTEVYGGSIIGVITGETRNVDYGSS